jgi:hypothetical protein
MSESAADGIVRDYFARLRRALAPLPRTRRNQLLDDLHEHVTTARADLAEDTEPHVREILDHLGTPEEIAAEALAGTRRPTRRRVIAAAAAVVVLAGGGTFGAIMASRGTAPAAAKTASDELANVPMANSDCAPTTDPAKSGGPAATLTGKATEVASGTTGGHRWSLWSAHGDSGATGLENGGLVIDGRGYGLCPGFPNPAELEMADVGPAALVYGVIGYPGLARTGLYTSTAGTFDRGQPLPAPAVKVVDGVSFFIGTLPRSACAYPSLELNSTSPGVSAEHNLGFGHCTAGKLVPESASQGIWQLPPGQFPAGFGNRPSVAASPRLRAGNLPLFDSTCAPPTDPAKSGGPAATLTSKATKVASGTTDGHQWSLWSARGQAGATGLENGGLLIDGRGYGLCPGFPNPAELEMADVGPHGIVFGVIGYSGRAAVHLYTSTAGTFDTGQALPGPAITVVHGVTFFIGFLPKSACGYPSLELNSAAAKGSSQHNFGFGHCVSGKLVEITSSMGAWNGG